MKSPTKLSPTAGNHTFAATTTTTPVNSSTLSKRNKDRDQVTDLLPLSPSLLQTPSSSSQQQQRRRAQEQQQQQQQSASSSSSSALSPLSPSRRRQLRASQQQQQQQQQVAATGNVRFYLQSSMYRRVASVRDRLVTPAGADFERYVRSRVKLLSNTTNNSSMISLDASWIAPDTPLSPRNADVSGSSSSSVNTSGITTTTTATSTAAQQQQQQGRMTPVRSRSRSSSCDRQHAVTGNFPYSSQHAVTQQYKDLWKGRRFKVLFQRNCKWIPATVVSWTEFNTGPNDREIKWTLTADIVQETVSSSSSLPHSKYGHAAAAAANNNNNNNDEDDHEFSPGSLVVVDGLTATPQHNERIALVKQIQPNKLKPVMTRSSSRRQQHQQSTDDAPSSTSTEKSNNNNNNNNNNMYVVQFGGLYDGKKQEEQLQKQQQAQQQLLQQNGAEGGGGSTNQNGNGRTRSLTTVMRLAVQREHLKLYQGPMTFHVKRINVNGGGILTMQGVPVGLGLGSQHLSFEWIDPVPAAESFQWYFEPDPLDAEWRQPRPEKVPSNEHENHNNADNENTGDGEDDITTAREVTYRKVEQLLEAWTDGGKQGHPYKDYLARLSDILSEASHEPQGLSRMRHILLTYSFHMVVMLRNIVLPKLDRRSVQVLPAVMEELQRDVDWFDRCFLQEVRHGMIVPPSTNPEDVAGNEEDAVQDFQELLLHQCACSMYQSVGEWYHERKEFRAAVYYYSKCIDLAERFATSCPEDIARFYSDIGTAYKRLGDLDAALRCFDRSLDYYHLEAVVTQRESLYDEMVEWTGTSGRLTPWKALRSSSTARERRLSIIINREELRH